MKFGHEIILDTPTWKQEKEWKNFFCQTRNPTVKISKNFSFTFHMLIQIFAYEFIFNFFLTRNLSSN